MALPGNPPATTTPAAFKTWAQNVVDTLNDIIAGNITFTGDIEIPDEAYDATAWNGSLEAPTKNAVRDLAVTLATLASPMFTGNPVAPTPSASDDDTSIATTGFVKDVAQQVYVHSAGSYALTGGRLFIGTEDPVADGFTMATGDEWVDTT